MTSAMDVAISGPILPSCRPWPLAPLPLDSRYRPWRPMPIRLSSRDRLVLPCAVSLALAVTAVSSASIVNGGFESPGAGYILVRAGQTLGGWTCVGSNVEYVHATATPGLPGLEFSAYEGNYWIDLGGVGGPSGIFQDLAGLVAGQAYRVTFAPAGNAWGPDIEFTLQVSWNGAGAGSFSSVHGGGNGANMKGTSGRST